MKPTGRPLTYSRFKRIIANLASSVSKPRYVVKSLLLLLVIIPGEPALADVKLTMDCSGELLDIGGVEPHGLLWDLIWKNCTDSGCHFARESFQTRVHDTDCELGNTYTCTVSVDGEFPGWDMRNMYGSALLQAVAQVQKQEWKSVHEYGPECHPSSTGANCFTCVSGNKPVADWWIPSRKRVYGWDTDDKFKGRLEYSTRCSS